jgi:anaerobic magnesium-protoporphyrin IX monomethyl ester cyclase
VADVLLTHSYHLAYDRKQVRKMQPYPPLGTLYAASVLRAHGISVAVFDTMLRSPAEFREALHYHRPRCVAIYEDDFNFLSKMCLTRMREVAWQISHEARSFGSTVISHGSDATDHPEEYLRHGSQFVLFGEAEIPLRSLCAALLKNGETDRIPGLGTLESGGKLRRQPGAPPTSAAWIDLPSPARDLIDLSPYRNAWTASHGYFSINMVASRGCPYRCNWCAKPISGDRFHMRSAESVANEMAELKLAYGAEHIWFGDDVFALNRHWVQELADCVQRRGEIAPFKVQSRADLMTAETVEALRRAGCTEVWMGVESGSQKVLDAMDKGLRVEQVESARRRLRNAGIRACYFVQFGYPGETWSDIQKTVRLVRETRPDDVGVSVSYPLPNTVFYQRIQEQLGPKRNWTDSEDLCLMFKAPYTDSFYHALRNALHAEVDSWSGTPHNEATSQHPAELWRQVVELEASSRTPDATRGWVDEPDSTHGLFIPVEELLPAGTES